MKEDVAAAGGTFQALAKTGIPDARSCKDMLSLYMKLSLIDKAKSFIVQVRKDGVNFDEELLKTVIKLYCQENMLKDAEQLIDDLNTIESFRNNKFIQTISLVMHGESVLPDGDDSFEPLDAHGTMAFGMMLSLYMADGNGSGIEEKLKFLLNTPNGLTVASQLIINFIKEGKNAHESDSLFSVPSFSFSQLKY